METFTQIKRLGNEVKNGKFKIYFKTNTTLLWRDVSLLNHTKVENLEYQVYRITVII